MEEEREEMKEKEKKLKQVVEEVEKGCLYDLEGPLLYDQHHHSGLMQIYVRSVNPN